MEDLVLSQEDVLPVTTIIKIKKEEYYQWKVK